MRAGEIVRGERNTAAQGDGWSMIGGFRPNSRTSRGTNEPISGRSASGGTPGFQRSSRRHLKLMQIQQQAMTINTTAIDQTKLQAFVMRAIGDLSAGSGGVMVSVGNKLGLYKAM